MDRLSTIRQHWTEAAATETDADGLRPTARDPYLQEVVETAACRYLKPGQILIDIGCGDGLSTRRFAQITGNALGLDYVQAFVTRAIKNGSDVPGLRFQQADVLDLSPFAAGGAHYDVAVTIRCLINLPDLDFQRRAIAQIASLVKPGGLYLASEGWQEDFDGLNAARQRAGLTPMQVAEYNCLMARGDFMGACEPFFQPAGYVNLGQYLYLSRVVQPLLTAPEPPRHAHPLNRVAAALFSAEAIDPDAYADCDYAGVYVLKRH